MDDIDPSKSMNLKEIKDINDFANFQNDINN